MPGPWEKYVQPEAADDAGAPAGPWAKYGAQAPEAPAAPSSIDDQGNMTPEAQSLKSNYVKSRSVGGKFADMMTGRPIPGQPEVAAGMPPMALPAGALGGLGRAAVALGEGQGLGYAAGRTALSAAQGVGMSAMDGKAGESWQDKLDRAKSGGLLSGGIQGAAESLPIAGKALGWGAKKIGEGLTGVAPDLIENFAKRTDQINQLIKKSGGNITQMADDIRSELTGGIQKAKGALNGQISAALEGSSKEANIPAQSIIDRLEEAKAKLNPNFKKAAISDLEEMISNVKSQAKDGMLDARGLYETKQYLGSEARGAYNKGGQIFTRAGEAARAAKEAAAEARDAIKTHIPEISQADAQLARMHAIEGRLNKNLLAPGTPEGALMAAGSGANPRNAANLRALEEISGVNASQRAKDLATAREFASPGLLPKDFTGKAALRMAVGLGAGGMLDGKEGALIGASLTSPMALKGVINAANVARKVGGAAGIPQVAQAIRQNPFAAQTAAQLGAAQIRRANTDNPMNGGTNEPPVLGGGVNRSPAKGEDAWARSGLQKLGIQDEAVSARLMADPKSKQLLIQASDLPPGSKAAKRIMEQIQKGWGGK